MNLKSIFCVKSLLLVGSFAVLVACKKENTIVNEDPATASSAISTSANDDNLADAVFMDLKEVLVQSLVKKTTGFLEQPSNTSLLQIVLWGINGCYLKSRFYSEGQLTTQSGSSYYN